MPLGYESSLARLWPPHRNRNHRRSLNLPSTNTPADLLCTQTLRPSLPCSLPSSQERLHQLCNHLPPSTTTMHRHGTDSAAPSHNHSAKEPKHDSCKFCKRPPTCPSCAAELAPPAKVGPTNIDGHVPDIYNQLPPPPPHIQPHADFLHCLPPHAPTYRDFSVFAAGSIEMGQAIQWQPLLADYLCHLPLTICNPRRGAWDSSITPSAKTAAFRQQVEWELDALTRCSVICFFFDHATMSPVTMCELGLWAHSGKVVVCCDRRFWKSGNVELVCERYRVPLVDTFADLVPLVKAKLRTKGMIVDKNGHVTDEQDENSMTFAEAEEYCNARTPERWGMAPDLDNMLNAVK